MNNILTAIGQFSEQVQDKFIQVVKNHLPAQELSLLKSFMAGKVHNSEQLQQLNNTLDTVFKITALQHFLNNEKEGGRSIGQVIYGNVAYNAHDQSTIVSGSVEGNVTTHHHQESTIIGGTHNHGDIEIQLNNSNVGGNINVNKSKP
jgi:hypothetical protein